VQVAGISFDSVDKNKAFADKFEYPFPLLCDTERRAGMAYGACDAPDAGYARRVSFLIDENGVILRAYPNVKAAEHPAEVLKDLDAMQGTGAGR
jgi:peroxiredoxin Q/BCP